MLFIMKMLMMIEYNEDADHYDDWMLFTMMKILIMLRIECFFIVNMLMILMMMIECCL